MNQVLILTNRQDLHVDLVIRSLSRRGVTAVRFHPDEFPQQKLCRYAQGIMHWNDPVGPSFSVDQITAVWYRRPHRCQPFDMIEDPADKRFSADEANHLIENMYMLLEGARWVNPYFSNIRARYKLLQARVAQDVGLEMPQTIVTNDPELASEFIGQHSGEVVYKCVRTGVLHKPDGSSDVVFTNKIRSDDIAHIEQVRLTPCVFQQYIPKALELRVTVVGSHVFTCAIYSQESVDTTIDWRRGAARHEVYQLPGDIRDKLLRFMAAFGLVYGAFDLVLTPEGRFVMLELNPNGQWAFVEGFTGLPISEAIADLLTSEDV